MQLLDAHQALLIWLALLMWAISLFNPRAQAAIGRKWGGGTVCAGGLMHSKHTTYRHASIYCSSVCDISNKLMATSSEQFKPNQKNI